MEKKALALIASIVVIAAVGIATVFVALPAMQPQVAEFELALVDYGYNEPGFGPTLTVKAGQLVRVKVINEGAQEHEFMVVEDKDMSLMMMKNMINNILSNETLTTEDQQIAMYDMMHHDMKMAMEDANGKEIRIEVEPDETGVLEFVIDVPGTYFFVCHNVGGTWPKIHQEEGMWGTLIVEEA